MEFCGPRGRFGVPWAASQILAPTSPRVGTGVFAWPSDVVGANTSPLRSGGGRRSVSKIWLSTNGSPALGETLGDADGEREREHHKKWIQIIQHVWKIFISFVFNHWGFWSHGGSQVILDFSLRNGKTWIIWDDDPQWDDESSLLGWVQGALNMADVTRKWWYHVILMSEFDGGRQLFEWCFFLSSFTTSKASCDMEYVYVYIYIVYVHTHTYIYIYTL